MDERLQNILRLASSMPHGKDGKFVTPAGAKGGRGTPVKIGATRIRRASKFGPGSYSKEELRKKGQKQMLAALARNQLNRSPAKQHTGAGTDEDGFPAGSKVPGRVRQATRQRASKFGRDSYTKEELRLKDQQELRDALKKLKANRKK
jgi:hypothetical protein